MRRLVLCALIAAACGGSDKPLLRDDAGTPPAADAGADAASARVVGCLDTAGVAAPPTEQLPCDLVPPGLAP